MPYSALITARLKSTRLPNKALRQLGDRSLIEHLLTRLRETRGVDDIWLCTSTLKDDDRLVEWAETNGVATFRGEPNDVLKRLADAAPRCAHEQLACVTADNPFVDAQHLDQLMAFHTENRLDYTRPVGLPLGTFGYALSRQALLQVVQLKQTEETEIWGPIVLATPGLRCGELVFTESLQQKYRLTIDTPEDWELAIRLEGTLRQRNLPITLMNLLVLLRENPTWQSLNQHIVQRSADSTADSKRNLTATCSGR